MVKVVIYFPKELSHSSYIHTGLFELERLGLIKCEISMKFRKGLGRTSLNNGTNSELPMPQPKTSFYELSDSSTNRTISFVTDLNDIPYYFSTIALEQCDYVFKRNYSESYISVLPSQFKKKIYPLGITFKVRSLAYNKKKIIQLGSVLTNLFENNKLDYDSFTRISNVIKHNRIERQNIKNTPMLERYDQYSKHTENKIIYQKRFFPYESEQDVREIHLQRYKFVKKLKESFGDSYFLGGLVPCSITKIRYPEYLTNLPISHNKYVDIMKKTRIAVYTRGLSNSIGWTFPEYLAAGKAILAERFNTILPEQLINGKHVIFFDDLEDCIKKARLLLKNEKKTEKLCKNSREYYDNYVNPVQNVRRMIELMIGRNLTR